ncbi:hypothetical protein UFOVP797_7 [uncultured Caudovirales phage]|uniref:Uncharacterized protein n=1 Tax=uncultured Caudovirales phage TaxID=2100421 RepID=A0A6J5P125_9CAUD|nr:hypothetical protein UFOVP797_7 [uncultured Caudovirales phage]
MTQWAPVWRVKINGTDVTGSVIANLAITSGRTNIYTQAQAGYCSITLIIFGQASLPYEINDTFSIEVQDTSAVYVPIFGGSVVDISVSVSQVGSSAYTQEVTITALGALARLQKALTDGVLTQDFDGNQIETILREVLFAQWQQVPAALQWNTYDPTTTWANAGNTGLGEIDTPGNYELAQRASDRAVVYDLVAALATSGAGYLYESASGLISYGDSTHRTTYLATYGYTDLTANQALGQGITIKTRAGDVRNDLTIKYGTASANEVSDTDEASIGLYGNLAQIITTTIKHAADATDQAAFYLALRANPQPIFDSITYALTNPELDNADRDALINIFMGQPIALNDLPSNMSAGVFQGFVEGWTFRASYNELAITLLMSPLAYSLQAMRWNDVPIVEQWNTVSPILDWANATIVS